MSEQPTIQNNAPQGAPANNSRGRGGARSDRPSSPRREGGRRDNQRPERQKPEFDQKIINIRRVTRVMAGGRRFSFSVVMVIGDKKGRVGVGIGKAGDTALAIQKAMRDAEKGMIRITTKVDGLSIPFDVSAKYNSARVIIMPNKGRGLVAGSAIRNILEHAGVTNITAKVHSGTKNPLNIARATIKALLQLPNVELAFKNEAEKPVVTS